MKITSIVTANDEVVTPYTSGFNADSSATKLYNRTMVQDNGATGDKLVNSMLDPAKLTAAALAKNTTCVKPDLAKLTAGKPLAGDAIQITGTTP